MSASGTVSNLHDLKSKIRRNPNAYKNDVLRQINHWESILSLLRISNKPNTTRQRTKDLQSLIDFLSAVVDRYPSEPRCYSLFPTNLLNILDEHNETLNTPIKKCIIKNLVVLQQKKLIDTTKLLSLFFRLLSLNAKILRFLIYSSIIKIITGINKRSKNETVNRSIQNYMFNMLKDENDVTVKKSLSILIELYRRNIWKNAKTVNIIASLCLYHKSSQILRNALHFMLGHKVSIYKEFKEEELKEMESKRLKSQIKELKFNTRRRTKKLLQIAKLEEKKEEQEMEQMINGGVSHHGIDLSAIRSLYDPQSFIEKMFKRLSKNKYLWDIKLLMMNLISRCISSHQLLLFPFYSFIIKYLKTSQKNVTQIIAFTAQSVHKLVPPEIIKPIITHIANEFIGQFACNESIAVGINGIRLICKRQPIAMDADVLSDLSEYSKYKKDNGVQMASRALIHLFRVENPMLLLSKHRGKYHSKEEDVLEYGEQRMINNIPGADLFEQEEEMLSTKVYVTKDEASFLELEKDEIAGNKQAEQEDEDHDIEMESDEDEMEVRYHVVEDEAARKAKRAKPLLIRRVLSEEDLERLKELRVNNLMKIWNRKREDVGLLEERESDDEIDYENEVESATTLAAKKKQMRKEAMKRANGTKNQKTWDQYRKEHGGGTTNKEKQRKKPFVMTKYALNVMRKGKRSVRLQKMILGQHKRRLKREGKRVKRRRR
eukprot:106644_1